MIENSRPDDGEATTPGGRPTPVSGAEILDAMADWTIGECRSYAQKLRMVADLYHSDDMCPPPAWTRHELTTEEIQGPFRINAFVAGQLVRRAVTLTGRLTGTLELLSDGTLDKTRAGAIADGLAPVLDATYEAVLKREGSPRAAEEAAQAVAAEFEARLLRRAPGQTVPRLQDAVRRAIAHLAPDYDEARRKLRNTGRDVFVTDRGQEPGMAFLGARLPAVEAHACYRELDTSARRLRRQGDARSLSALRADLLIDRILRRAADSDQIAAPVPDGESAAGDPVDGAGSPERPERPRDGWVPGHPVARGVKTHVQITISIETLLGLNDDAAELTGYGAISARVAREAAMQAGSVWRRLVIDPLTGNLLDYGRKTYRPPAALADHVIARDVTCRHPGCQRPAELSDVDHIVPYPLGSTSEDNLVARCRRHHRLKHEGGWHTELSTDPDDPVGTTITTSRTGRQYKSHRPDLRPDDRAEDDREEHEPVDEPTRLLADRALRLLNQQARDQGPVGDPDGAEPGGDEPADDELSDEPPDPTTTPEAEAADPGPGEAPPF